MESSQDQKVQWTVDGMTCANCALTVNKYLQQQGLRGVTVNPVNGEVIFNASGNQALDPIKKGIAGLGYQVVDETVPADQVRKPFLSTAFGRFLFCLPFSLVLMLHMIPWLHIHLLMNPWVQLALALPPFILGMMFFGRSAIKSLQHGIPNMNVLITVGAAAAFIYSLVGTLAGAGMEHVYYETAATIITLVFLGNYLEDSTMQQTQRALKALVRNRKIMANMIAYDDQHQEQVFPVDSESLRSGDLILIREGEQVPADARVLAGEALVDESLLTGESLPVSRSKKDMLTGGSTVHQGHLKAQVTAAGKDSVLSRILSMVSQAQTEKAPVQLLADKISAIFVPLVLIIALITLIGNWIALDSFTPAMIRAVAVLVIACPCAMGLATPAAIAVGLGRGARNGMLFRTSSVLEQFRNIQQVVFDKTGTLTTGAFKIDAFETSLDEASFKSIILSLEKYSTHPLAKSVVSQWSGARIINWKSATEVKGGGIRALDKDGKEYLLGSAAFTSQIAGEHSMYLTIDGNPSGWIDMADELRPEAADVINYFKKQGIKTVLLSGDSEVKCQQLAGNLGIDEVLAGQTPAQKLEQIKSRSAKETVIMIGDGINDAPALAAATIGISMSEATQIAMQTADVVLMNSGLSKLSSAVELGKKTYSTIQQNLFWAFSYNIFAIPLAAFGFLGTYGPIYGALIMALSDVVLAVNSARLFIRRI